MPRRPSFNDEVLRLARRMIRGVEPGLPSDVARPREGEVVHEQQRSQGRFVDVGPDFNPQPTVRRRRIVPRRRTSARGSYGEPVFTWAFRSSQPRGGQIITYETRLEEDGVLRCNCPGWIFCKVEKGANGLPLVPKTCKHTNMVKDEAPDILRRFRRGEELPMLDVDQTASTVGTTSGRLSSRTPSVQNIPRKLDDQHSKIRYGRVIEI